MFSLIRLQACLRSRALCLVLTLARARPNLGRMLLFKWTGFKGSLFFNIQIFFPYIGQRISIIQGLWFQSSILFSSFEALSPLLITGWWVRLFIAQPHPTEEIVKDCYWNSETAPDSFGKLSNLNFPLFLWLPLHRCIGRPKTPPLISPIVAWTPEFLQSLLHLAKKQWRRKSWGSFGSWSFFWHQVGWWLYYVGI